ncbi:peptidoglycan DD-metalloendopeptidase family protein [Kocuria marina]|uniref:M23 family metallopeptidase n=1 Tax=Kocuria marina TaxID=223184 RepID=UPI002989BE75|nr:peptidoglycan DD-metalloendopeptidase family protein [Kocuria marina]MCT1723726.1 peptidoglycan DD-metalloendopeptidase family protein [Kocuria marina]MCT1734565.1 peptidoglycan DD-metalloendopeptidase family protein [Kocuria marina]
MTRSRSRAAAARKPSMALTAFTSFSMLVAVSVALSNGTETAPWQPAMAHDAQGPQRPGVPAPADDAAQPAQASLFAVVPDQAAIAASHDVPVTAPGTFVRNAVEIAPGGSGPRASGAGGAGAAGSGSGSGSSGSGSGAGDTSPVAPSTRAPATFEGELPVNTIIAPAQPVVVLDGGRFGWRIAPDTKQKDFHNGTDISVPEGTPVVAALDGTVTAVFWDVWGGNRVEVTHADGVKTTYNHLKDVMVRVGDTLRASEQLGTVGQTGLRVTGPHLHFEIWVHGKVADPESFDWETGKGVIPASRAPYSTEDQAAMQPPMDPHAEPGTDSGPAPADVPDADHERVMALGRKTPQPAAASSNSGKPAAAKQASGEKAGNDAKKSAPQAAPATKAPAEKGPAHEPGSTTTLRPNTTPSAPSTPGTSEQTPGGATPGGHDSGAKKPGDKTPTPIPSKSGGPTGKPVQPEPDKSGKPVQPEPDKSGKPVQPEPDKSGKPVQPEPDKSGKPVQPEPGKSGKPVQPEPGKSGKPVQPEPGKSDKPVQPEPGKSDKPVPPEPGKPGDGPVTPAVNPYTAPVNQLTTLEQVQQRTQHLLATQLVLTPAQQFGPATQLNTQLTLLSQRLTGSKLAAADPSFAAQLNKTQHAVAAASAKPADKKLTAAATAELATLQKLVADAPPYQPPAPSAKDG